MDRAAPRASRPPASGTATPRIDEIRAAKRKLARLLEDFDASQTAARRARTSSEAQELIDQVVKAGSTVLDYYASLPQALARRILPDDQARRVRDETLEAGDQCNTLATKTIYELEPSRKSAAAVLERMRQSNAPPDQLSRAIASVAKHHSLVWGY